jgi:hypothetical protein
MFSTAGFLGGSEAASQKPCLLDLKYCHSERNAVERRIFLIEIRFSQTAVFKNYELRV